MYVEPWQIFLCGCVVGTLIAFIVLTAFAIKLLSHIGVQNIKFDNGAESAKEAIENDLVAKLCFILLAKGYLDEVDNDFMLDNIAFQRWKTHVEEELTEPEEDEDDPKDEIAGLRLLLDWAIDCGFGYDNIPEEYEKYKNEIEGLGYTEGLIYIATQEAKQLSNDQAGNN